MLGRAELRAAGSDKLCAQLSAACGSFSAHWREYCRADFAASRRPLLRKATPRRSPDPSAPLRDDRVERVLTRRPPEVLRPIQGGLHIGGGELAAIDLTASSCIYRPATRHVVRGAVRIALRPARENFSPRDFSLRSPATPGSSKRGGRIVLSPLARDVAGRAITRGAGARPRSWWKLPADLCLPEESTVCSALSRLWLAAGCSPCESPCVSWPAKSRRRPGCIVASDPGGAALPLRGGDRVSARPAGKDRPIEFSDCARSGKGWSMASGGFGLVSARESNRLQALSRSWPGAFAGPRGSRRSHPFRPRTHGGRDHQRRSRACRWFVRRRAPPAVGFRPAPSSMLR